MQETPAPGPPRPRLRLAARIDAVVRPRLAFIQRALGSPLRTPRMAVVLGRLLGFGFVICFVTGLYSHALQTPWPWFVAPTRPVYLYAWTQGIHVVVGLMLVPVLLAKLWVVFPGLFKWPVLTGLRSVVERGSILVLVSCALALPLTGVLNVVQVYPWDFSFRRTHYAMAWLLIGALLIHVAVQLPTILTFWRRERAPRDTAEAECTTRPGLEPGAGPRPETGEDQG